MRNCRPLEDIGFYTLSDKRAKSTYSRSPMMRGEMILTGRCNFSCVYCRGLREDCHGDMDPVSVAHVLEWWAADGLVNVRFSGGEPTLYPDLADVVRFTKTLAVERIAISTNGSAPLEYYQELIDMGVDDFSISLDACCAADAEKMAGRWVDFKGIARNIKELSKLTYVTVGVVVTGDSVAELFEVISFAGGLGVDDIRVIPSAQWNLRLRLREMLTDWGRFPILSYRLANIQAGRHVRGLTNGDSDRCYLVLDDSAVAGKWHFPCIIYLREGGDPIGRVGERMRLKRLQWFLEQDTKKDPICAANCLDVCIDYNNRCRQYELRQA